MVDELEPGLVAVAAPIFDAHGAVVGGISVSGPTLRVGPEDIPQIAEAIFFKLVMRPVGALLFGYLGER